MILLADEELLKDLKQGKNLMFPKGISVKNIEKIFNKRKVVNVWINPTDIKDASEP